MINMKIIRIIQTFFINISVVPKITEITTTLNNLENILIQQKVETNDLILFSSSLVLKFPARKKNKEKKNGNNQNYIKTKEKNKTFTPLPLKNPEHQNMINNFFKKYNLFILFHKGFVEPITHFNIPNKNNEKIFLPVKMQNKNFNSNKNPVLIGNILYGNFIREDILVFLLCFYKKLTCKKIVLVTYGKPNFNSFNNNQDVIIISIEHDQDYNK